MSRLILRVTADAVVNKGGGIKDRKIRDLPDNKIKFQRKKDTGSDYVVFHCPRCGKRQKRCVWDCKYTTDSGELIFGCNQGCDIDIEVAHPPKKEDKPSVKLIMTPDEYRRTRQQQPQPLEIARG